MSSKSSSIRFGACFGACFGVCFEDFSGAVSKSPNSSSSADTLSASKRISEVYDFSLRLRTFVAWALVGFSGEGGTTLESSFSANICSSFPEKNSSVEARNLLGLVGIVETLFEE